MLKDETMNQKRIWSFGKLASAAVLAMVVGMSVRVIAEPAPATAEATSKKTDDATRLDKFGTFVPAFTEAAIDFDSCKTIVNGKAEAVHYWNVRRALGLIPTSENWNYNQLELAEGEKNKETTFGYLIVLKKAMEVGTLAATPANLGEGKESTNNGELFYVGGDVKEVPDVSKEAEWKKVAFDTPSQYLRFSTLPKGTTVKALYFKDVRTAGGSQLVYLHAYKNRLENVTSKATGSSEPKETVKAAAGLPKGSGWAVELKEAALKTPVSYTLTWDKPQKLSGVFLYSNADKFRLLTYTGKEGGAANAGADAWKPIEYKADWDNIHGWENWHFNYRWLSFPTLETSALRVEVNAADGGTLWITGLGAVTVAKD